MRAPRRRPVAMAHLEPEPRIADATVRFDGSLAPIDEQWFKNLLRQSLSFGLHVMSVMAGRLRRHRTYTNI